MRVHGATRNDWFIGEELVSTSFALGIARELDAAQAQIATLTEERKATFLHEQARLELDTIVASCDCLTKSPEVQYHKPGCRYRLICERDASRALCAKLRTALVKATYPRCTCGANTACDEPHRDDCITFAALTETQADTKPARDLAARISQYLQVGGLFNPEAMEHDKVRDLLMEIRDHLDGK